MNDKDKDRTKNHNKQTKTTTDTIGEKGTEAQKEKGDDKEREET